MLFGRQVKGVINYILQHDQEIHVHIPVKNPGPLILSFFYVISKPLVVVLCYVMFPASSCSAVQAYTPLRDELGLTRRHSNAACFTSTVTI